MTSTTEDYYTILKCEQWATHEELKHSYQELIRKYHPDKNDGLETEEFLKVDKAWKTLRDGKLRKEYDNYLFSQMQTDVLHAELSKCDLSFNCDNVAFYPCRCSEQFTIKKEYFEEAEEFVLECGQCSTCVLFKR